MLNRLPALQKAAGVLPNSQEDVSVGVDTPSSSSFCDLLASDTSMHNTFAEVRTHFEVIRGISEEMKGAVLPARFQQLTAQFDSEDKYCQHLLSRGQECLTTLRNTSQAESGASARVQENLLRILADDLCLLMQEMLNIRSQHSEEGKKRAQRQLRFAYPDADESTIQKALENLNIAKCAVSQRAEGGAEDANLDVVLEELEKQRTDAKKLEEGAHDLKMMFMQFATLVDQQGETFNSVERNVKTTEVNTKKASVNLVEALAQKRSADSKRAWLWTIGGCAALIFVVWFLGGAVVALASSMFHNEPKRVMPNSLPVSANVPEKNPALMHGAVKDTELSTQKHGDMRPLPVDVQATRRVKPHLDLELQSRPRLKDRSKPMLQQSAEQSLYQHVAFREEAVSHGRNKHPQHLSPDLASRVQAVSVEPRGHQHAM